MVVPGAEQAQAAPSAPSPRGPVTVVSAPSTVLGPALATALVRHGWRTRLVEDDRPPGVVLSGATVLVVDDDAGLPRVRPPADLPLRSCVCVGSVTSLPVLRLLHRRGAAVVDRAADFLLVLGAVELFLLGSRRRWAADRVLAVALERRQHERAALATLTPAEGEVLGAMLAGLGAAEIGRVRHVAVSTVRSQIRAILAKLGVTTQLSAVAVARRSSDHPWPGQEPARFSSVADLAAGGPHQFW